jgi:hypothetical protein
MEQWLDLIVYLSGVHGFWEALGTGVLGVTGLVFPPAAIWVGKALAKARENRVAIDQLTRAIAEAAGSEDKQKAYIEAAKKFGLRVAARELVASGHLPGITEADLQEGPHGE